MNRERRKDEVLEALCAGRITASQASLIIDELERSQAEGHLKRCRDCGQTIYLHRDRYGQWRPYESWVAGNAEEGEFTLHRCPTRPMEHDFMRAKLRELCATMLGVDGGG
jgi:DNA-binding transcriptional ArsR family regulator